MLETSVGRLFQRAVGRFGDRVAARQEGRALTYRQLGESVARLANALLAAGLAPGDRVVVLMWNCLEYMVCDFAAATAGLIKVPLNHMLTRDDVRFRIRDSQAAAVVCDEAFRDLVEELRPECPSVRLFVCVGDQPGRMLSFDQLVARGSSRPPTIAVAPDDLLGIMYTGGTTGRSKGVMHTHKSVTAIGFSQLVEFDIGWGETILHMAPLPHAAQFVMLSGVLRGGTQVLMRRFDPERMLDTIERQQVTWTFMVPTMMYVLMEHPGLDRYDWSSLATVLYGGAPILPEKLEAIVDRMGPIFLQSYSQMEVANQTTTLTKEDHGVALRDAPARLASCGRPVVMSQVRLVDTAGADVGPGEPGEIITRGPHMMAGYWRREDETASTIRNGWVHTGDVARADEQGYVYIVDRVKDMIISGGMNVYSVEVENVLIRHPGVGEVCVVGAPDPKWGEAVVALVVVRPGVTLTEGEVKRFCDDKLAAYCRPKRVEFVDAIPRTVYGKPDKKAARARFWQGAERQVH